jgi:hypothetical protein
MKAATLALVVNCRGPQPELVEILSDDKEIEVLEAHLQGQAGEAPSDPIGAVHEYRQSQAREEEEFGDYIEELLSHPFVRPEVQEHAVAWFKSKIRIEQYQKAELEAAKVIADFAYKVFRDDPSRQDFFLSGPSHMVRIRIFVIEDQSSTEAA